MFRLATQCQLANCEPVYEEMPGWNTLHSRGAKIFAASFGGEKIRQIHLRIDRSKIVDGQRRAERAARQSFL